MAILWMEGWEGFSNYFDVQNRYITSTSISSSSFGTGRDGVGRAYSLTFTSADVWITYPATTANVVLGFGFKANSTFNSSDMAILCAESSLSEQIVIRRVSTGEIAIDRGSTQLGITSGLGLLNDTWYYLELDVTFGDGTAGSIDLFINGNNELSVSSIDTRNVTGENTAALNLTGSSTAFDDMYLLDDSGTDQTTRIGPCNIETVIPNADGTTVNFTPSAGSNWQNVDDGNTPDDDTTYNSSSTATHKDLYGMAALAGSIGTVYAVMPRSYVRTVDSGGRGVKNVARSSATEVDGTEKFIDQSYIYVDHIYENDPNGGGAWTESSVNAAEFGIKITT